MAGKRIVLVVDDERDILDAATVLLEDLPGLAVAAYPSAAAALEALPGLGADLRLILSDFRMPGMDGLEFLAKAEQLRPDVPRILMTAYAETGLAVRAINEARIARFLSKPIEPAAMEAAVREVIAASELERSRAEALRRSVGLLGGRPPPP